MRHLTSWRSLALVFALLCSMLFAAPAANAAAATIFTVCGDAADGSKETAIRDAQKKAVAKALAHLVTQDNPSYAKLLADYRSFAAEPQVFNKKTQNGHLLLFSKVSVDVDAIQQALQDANSAKQESHSDQLAYFLVRVTGIPANGDDAAAQAQIIKTYNDTFGRLGFEVGTEDAIFNALAAYRSVPYESFASGMQQKVETDPDYMAVTMAVIGEIAFSGDPQDGVFHRRATVQVKAYDVLSKQVIASYEDAFELQHKNPKAADKMLLDKAAVTSARAIADQTATHWSKRS